MANNLTEPLRRENNFLVLFKSDKLLSDSHADSCVLHIDGLMLYMQAFVSLIIKSTRITNGQIIVMTELPVCFHIKHVLSCYCV